MSLSRQRLEALTEAAWKAAESNVDFGGRRVFLVGEIEEDIAKKFLVGFHMLDDTAGPIEVVLNTIGGNVGDGFGMYDAMRLARNQVTVKAYGNVLSCGALLLQGGDRRLVAPTTRGMIHDGYEPLEGTFSAAELKSLGKENEDTSQLYYQILAQRSKLTIPEVREMCKNETYMSADELVKNGLADGFIEKGTHKCRTRSKKPKKPSRRTGKKR